MGPFAQDTLAGILGMAAEQERVKGTPAPLGMQPAIDTTAAPGFVGINGQGITGKELPGLEGLSKVPGHDTLMAAAQNGMGDQLKVGGGQQNPMAAILGMEALKTLAAPPPQQQIPGGGAPVAPRGTQVSVAKPNERLDVSGPKSGMSKLMYGGR